MDLEEILKNQDHIALHAYLLNGGNYEQVTNASHTEYHSVVWNCIAEFESAISTILFQRVLTAYIQKNNIDLFTNMIDRFHYKLQNVSMQVSVAKIICSSCNYEIYMKFIKLYPESMQYYPELKGSHPCASFNIVVGHGTTFSTKTKMRNLIIHHYLDNYDHPNHTIYLKLLKNQSSIEIIFMLIDKIKDHREYLNEALLMCINQCKSIDIIRKILELGADPNSYDIFGDAVEKALTNRNTPEIMMQLIELLEEYDVVITPKHLLATITYDSIAPFAYILNKYQFDVNMKINNDYIIHCVMDCMAQKIFMYLINETDMNLHVIDSDGSTLLHLYLRYMNMPECDMFEIFKKLIDNGVDPYARNNSGACFFHIDLGANDIKILHKLGIDLSIRPNNDDKYSIYKNLYNYQMIEDTDDVEYPEIVDILVNQQKIDFPENEHFILKELDDAMKFDNSDLSPEYLYRYIRCAKTLRELFGVELSDSLNKMIREYC